MVEDRRDHVGREECNARHDAILSTMEDMKRDIRGLYSKINRLTQAAVGVSFSITAAVVVFAFKGCM